MENKTTEQLKREWESGQLNTAKQLSGCKSGNCGLPRSKKTSPYRIIRAKISQPTLEIVNKYNAEKRKRN